MEYRDISSCPFETDSFFSFLKEFYPLPGVELRGGSGPNEGNIWVDGEPVCDDTFTESSHGEVNARVICRYVFLKIRNC